MQYSGRGRGESGGVTGRREPAAAPAAPAGRERPERSLRRLAALDDSAWMPHQARSSGDRPERGRQDTLFNVICGFVRPDSGSIAFDGPGSTTLPHRLAALGIVALSRGGLWTSLTVVENVMTGLHRESRGHRLGSARPAPLLRTRRASARRSPPREPRVAEYPTAPSSLPYPIQKRWPSPGARERAEAPPPRRAGERLSELTSSSWRRRCSRCGATSRRPRRAPMDLVMSVCDRLEVLDFASDRLGTPAVVKSNPLVTPPISERRRSGRDDRRRGRRDGDAASTRRRTQSTGEASAERRLDREASPLLRRSGPSTT